jgi:hypothetical protein
MGGTRCYPERNLDLRARVGKLNTMCRLSSESMPPHILKAFLELYGLVANYA